MTTKAQVVETLVALADTLTADFDTLEYLYTLTDWTADLLDAAEAVVLLRDDTSQLTVAAATTADLRALALFEAEEHEGPSYDAYCRGEGVREPDLKEAGHWPEFAVRAADLGYRAVSAAPVQLRGQRIGALNAYRANPGSFDADDHVTVRGLADMAAISILTARARHTAENQVAQQRQALANRAVVEQAKGMLAERGRISPDSAFDQLRRHARNHNHKLRDVAHRFLQGELGSDDLADAQ